MRLFALDARLRAIAERIPQGARIWDVGTDHARLPVWLIVSGKIETAVVSDIGEGPLDSARGTAKTFGVSKKMEFVLRDGLPENAPEKANTFIIAGMGGGTIASILERAKWTQKKGVSLFLQAMSSAEDLRAFLYAGNYKITAETPISDGHRRYVIIEAEGGGAPETFDRADLISGKLIFEREHILRGIKRLENEISGENDKQKPALFAAVKKLEGYIDGDS